MDGIVCSGGNTLNQQAIWKAQGIDVVLSEAWDRGIVLGGASAGSLCWFEEGTTDSRPKELSIVKCLGFLKGSHSPHYDAEPGRRPLYQKLIGSGQMKPGYACDNDAGIYFEDNEVKRVVAHARGGEGVLRQRRRRESRREGDGAGADRMNCDRWPSSSIIDDRKWTMANASAIGQSRLAIRQFVDESIEQLANCEFRSGNWRCHCHCPIPDCQLSINCGDSRRRPQITPS